MRIIYLHQYFNTPSQTGSTRSYEIGRRLVQAGHEVHMITSNRSAGGYYESYESGIKVYWIPVNYSNKMKFYQRIYSFLKFALLASWKALNIKGELIFASSTPLTICIPGLIASKVKKLPMVFEVRDLWPEIPIAMGAISNPLVVKLTTWLELIAYRNSSKIITLSKGMYEGVQKRGIPAEKILTIPNSSDKSLFVRIGDRGLLRTQHGIPKDSIVLLYAGTLGRVNGVGYLVELACELRKINSPIIILVVGDGLEREGVRDLAGQRGVLGENFFMLPPISKEKIPEIFSASDLIASTTIDIKELWNNSANKVFDCFAAGKPLVINHEGWIAELIRNREVGIVLPPVVTEESAKQLDYFANCRDLMIRAGENAKKLSESEFDQDVLFRRLHSALMEIV